MSHDTTVTSPFHSSSFKVSNLQQSKMLALKSTWASFSTPGVKHQENRTEYLLTSLSKINFYYTFYRRYPSMHRRRSSGGRGGEGDPWPARFGAKKHKDEFDNTCDMGDFRAHIFCPQMTQELPKKHYEAGLPEQLPTGALSQIDYGHNRHCEDCKEICLC